MPLLWFLRDSLRLTGTKYGCGKGLCGACTVHVDGRAQRSCLLPVAAVAGRSVTTIEGLSDHSDALHPVQQAWIECDVSQCGYCQAGQVMSAVDLLTRIPNPTKEQIDAQVANLCRCGTFYRIREAVQKAAELIATSTERPQRD